MIGEIEFPYRDVTLNTAREDYSSDITTKERVGLKTTTTTTYGSGGDRNLDCYSQITSMFKMKAKSDD